jgi:cytochrome c-type biogenesis protein CcmH
MRMGRARSLLVALAALVALVPGAPALVSLLPAAPAFGAVHPRTSLTAVENDLMCVVCHEPLAVAQSPEAEAERQLISQLIARGYTKSHIEQVMVAQYGTSVLARPPAQGFDLSVYLIPPAAVLVGLAVVGFALRRWRRSRGDPREPAAVAPLSAGDARRLEEDLAHYKG